MLALVAFLTLVALAIPVEHLAFSRHPRLIDNEVARRAVGIGTVMLLGLIPVAFGGLDWRTWATLLAGFLLAGAVLGVMLMWDRRAEKAARVERTRRALDEHIERWVGTDAD